MDQVDNINNQGGRWQRSVELTKSAWQVFKLDKELTTLPLIGFLISLPVLIVSGIVAAIAKSTTSGSPQTQKLLEVVGFVLFTLAITTIANFISSAIIRGAIDRFEGKDPTVGSSLAAARAKFGSIFAFSVLATTVGLVLRFLQDRLPLAGKIFVWLGDIAWSIATLFALPYIVTSPTNLGPVEATKKSASLIKSVWGESLIISAGIGLIALLSTIAYILIAVLLVALSAAAGPIAIGIVASLAVLGLIALILVLNVLSAIARAAIFYCATTGKAPASFNKDLLRSALTPKKARRIFA